MAEIISGDKTKEIKNVGELSLRISRFDSYRLFTLYNKNEVMDVSGNQKYYLVFRSPNKEIRIPEYDPKGFFEVDKVNGCVLFKITKKNAEDILGMKTAGEKIYHIIRVYEETDALGKVLSVTDEVEVYHGKWGDDEAFNTFTTENKVDLLTKSLAEQIAKNALQLSEYEDLLKKYNEEVVKNGELQNQVTSLTSERDILQTQLNEYLGDTYDGTLLSTDMKYIAFEDTLQNIYFTEEQYKNAMDQLLTTGSVDLTSDEFVGEDKDDPKINLDVKIDENDFDIEVSVFKNGSDEKIGVALHGDDLYIKNNEIENNTEYIFEYTGEKNIIDEFVGVDEQGWQKYEIVSLYLEFVPYNENLKNVVIFKVGDNEYTNSAEIKLSESGNNIKAILKIDNIVGENSDEEISAIGVIGVLRCRVKKKIITKE